MTLPATMESALRRARGMSTLVGIKAYKLHIPLIRLSKWNPRPPMWGQQGAHARMNVALTRPSRPARS